MSSPFSKWYPSEQEITTKNASIPTLLCFFQENLLYSSDKQTHHWNQFISSIAQDLIYNTTNCESKTVKYVELGLCTKRKTCYRKLITWLNRLGQSIPYHDVNLVETHIAEEQIANVTTAAYVLNNITPEEFETFVYDNDDINVESVYGRSYHCTNAIAIHQKSNDRPEQTPAPATVTSNYRRRSLKPIINSTKPAVKIPRSDPQLKYNSEVENNMIYEALAKTEDLTWCFLRLEASAHNQNQTIPGWSGFSAATSDISEDVSNVTFLPSINQAPAELSTIAEIVKQVKLKFQALSLKEVNLVADHAIFSKLFEVITGLDPERRSLVNLRMGGFHIEIIGKYFAESGLSDLVVEAGILGPNAVERAMNGKHYNNQCRSYVQNCV